VSAFGLVDTTAWYGPDAPRQWEERAQRALEQGLRSLVDFQVTRWFSERFRKDSPEAVQRAVATFLTNDVQAYAASCRMLGAADLRAVLRGGLCDAGQHGARPAAGHPWREPLQ
jgi:3-oxoadipate enol-lactonase